MFTVPPVDMANYTGVPYFYRDPQYSFERIFLCGSEFTMLLSVLLFYAFVDLLSQNTFLSVFVSFVFDKLLVWLRSNGGSKNLSKKTLIDERFLA